MKRLTTQQLENRVKQLTAAGYDRQTIENRIKQLEQAGQLERQSEAPISETLQKGGPLQKLLGSIAQPIEKWGRFGAGAVESLGVQGLALAGGDKMKERLASKGYGDGNYSKLLSDRQEQVLSSRKAAPVIKEGVNLGADAIPYVLPSAGMAKGLGWKTAAGLGAKTGAVRGATRAYGNTLYGQEGNQIMNPELAASTITGAATGAAIEGATSALTSAFRNRTPKTKTVAKTTDVDLKGKALKDDPFFSENKQFMDDIAREAGLDDKKLTPYQKTEKVFEKFQEYKADQLKRIEGKPITLDHKKDILKNFDEYMKANVDADKFNPKLPSNKDFLNNLTSRIKNVNKAEELLDINSQIGHNVKWGGVGSAKAEAHRGMWEAVRKTLDGIDPQISVLGKKEKALYEISKELVRNVKYDQPARIGAKGLGIDLPFTKGQGKAAAARVGDFFMKPAKGAKNIGGDVFSSILGSDPIMQQAVGKVPTMLASDSFSKDQPLRGLDNAIQQQGSMETGAPQGPITYFEAMQLAPTLMEQYGEDVMKKLWIIHPSGKAIWNPMTQSTIAYNPDMFGGSGGGDEYGNRAVDLVSRLKDLYTQTQEQGLTGTGSGLGRLQGLLGGAAAGLQTSPEAASYKRTLDSFMATLSRASGEKGTLTDQDIARVMKAFPKFTDSPQVAAQQWSNIDVLLRGLEAQYQMSPGTLTGGF